MLHEKKPEYHAGGEVEEKQQINFAWILMIGTQMGFSKEEIRYMYFGEWSDLFAEYKKFYNFKMKKYLFKEAEKPVSMLDL